jgi:hypothetical protein
MVDSPLALPFARNPIHLIKFPGTWRLVRGETQEKAVESCGIVYL